jgi:hypothetical protein
VWVNVLKRPRRNLRTGFRHSDVVGANNAEDKTWPELYTHWRGQYFRFIDKTFFEQEYQKYIDEVEEANEYTDNAMARGAKPLEMKRALRNATAAVHVWNSEFRGRTVRTPDGGEGFIPAECQLVIGQVPVGNDIPKSFFELAKASGNRLGYHPYMSRFRRLIDGQWVGWRDPGDWEFHSGRWWYNEQEYGIKVEWSLNEAGPYKNAIDGWLHSDVCGGEVPLLVAAYVDWARDTVKTQAFKDGRVSPPAMYTIGNVGWPLYQLRTEHLKAIGDGLRPIWVPAPPTPTPIPVPIPPGDPVGIPATVKAELIARTNELQSDLNELREKIAALQEQQTPTPLYRGKALNILYLRDRQGNLLFNPDGTIASVPKDGIVNVWEQLDVIGPNAVGEVYDDRAVVAQDGRNVYEARLLKIEE